jgi:IS1 family transposase
VDRRTRCFIGCNVVWERETENLQRVVDQGPRAKQYYSDAFPTYAGLVYYPGKYAVSEGKANTYSVEGDNAELRHYLARLGRKSRCFSRCPYALCYALKLFFFAFNSRQLYKQQFPNYPAHVFQFATP